MTSQATAVARPNIALVKYWASVTGPSTCPPPPPCPSPWIDFRHALRSGGVSIETRSRSTAHPPALVPLRGWSRSWTSWIPSAHPAA